MGRGKIKIYIYLWMTPSSNRDVIEMSTNDYENKHSLLSRQSTLDMLLIRRHFIFLKKYSEYIRGSLKSLRTILDFYENSKSKNILDLEFLLKILDFYKKFGRSSIFSKIFLKIPLLKNPSPIFIKLLGLLLVTVCYINIIAGIFH